MNIEFFKNREETARAAGEYVSGRLEQAGRAPVLLLLAGGSSFALLDFIRSEALHKRVTIAVSDERWSSDPRVSNFGQLAAADFYRRASERNAAFIDTRVRDGESLKDLAARFEADMRAWRAVNPAGNIFMTQGIGPDGHTCGIMPYPEDPRRFAELFLDPARWVVGYDADGKNEYPLRITVTPPFLRNEVAESVVYVAGEQKRAALGRVLAPSGDVAETPGRILREMQSTRIFTDLRDL